MISFNLVPFHEKLMKYGEIIKKQDINKNYGIITFRYVKYDERYFLDIMLNGKIVAIILMETGEIDGIYE